MDYSQVLKTYRKKVLAGPDDLPQQLSYNQEIIKKIIPHRDPFLLLDALTGLDISQEIMTASRTMDPDDPVFKGHFPDYPVYPGAMQLEMIGQAGLCLYYFLQQQTSTIVDDARPVNVMATKVLGAQFMEPVLPGQKVTLAVKKLEQDDYFGSAVGQVCCGPKICSVSISEVCFLD